jgi:hypothetical protein
VGALPYVFLYDRSVSFTRTSHQLELIMDVSVLDPALATTLLDSRAIPITELTSDSYDLDSIVQRAIPLSADQERPTVSAFNSSI